MEMVDLADLQHLSQRLQQSVSGATINSQRLNNVPDLVSIYLGGSKSISSSG